MSKPASGGMGTILQLAQRVLKPVFGQASWNNWLVLLSALFALPLDEGQRATFERLTGRTHPPLPGECVRECWFIVGRRAGKSFISALIAIFLTCCRTYRLAPGERGVFMVIAADRRQARVVKQYISGLMHLAAPLEKLIADETKETIELTNGISIEIKTASWRTLRGYTVVGAVCDEVAFWMSEDSANPDTEILAALRPAMATVPDALLVCITSPYARRGEPYRAYRDHFGKNDDPVLVAQGATELMNPLVPPAFIEQAYREDPERAAAEFGAQFRSDLESCFSREVLTAATIPGRIELPAMSGEQAFTDPAGGSGADSFTLAIARAEGEQWVLTVMREARPPFSPERTVEEFAALLKGRGISRVHGDRYAGEWPREQFRKHGVEYLVSERTASDIYRELVALLNSQRVQLLDMPRLLGQLATLDRRTGRAGRDVISHAPNGHDDLANAAAGAILLVSQRACMAAGMLSDDEEYLPPFTRLSTRMFHARILDEGTR